MTMIYVRTIKQRRLYNTEDGREYAVALVVTRDNTGERVYKVVWGPYSGHGPVHPDKLPMTRYASVRLDLMELEFQKLCDLLGESA